MMERVRRYSESYSAGWSMGRGAGFSVEGPTGQRFIIRSRMLREDELVHFNLGPAG